MGNLRCPISSCPLYKKSSCTATTENTNIHKFPNNDKYRSSWEEFVSDQNGATYICKRNDGLCNSHFEAKWVMPSGRLIMDAKPSIAPMSTKQLLCKWDATTSKIVHIEDQATSIKDQLITPKKARLEDLPSVIETWANIRAKKKTVYLEAQERARVKREILEKEKLVERLKAESAENAELDALCFEDMEDCESLMGDEQAVEEVIACLPDASSSGHILSADSLSALETECAESALIPERPKSLDTIANVEQAIIREKRLTLLRYQAGMRRIKGLEVLLKRLQQPPSSKLDCSSSESLIPLSSPVISSPVVSITPKSQLKLSSPFNSLLKPSIPPVTPMTFPSSKTKAISELDLPPPLFDDYN